MLRPLLLIAVASTMVGSAEASPPPERAARPVSSDQCFYAADVTGFHASSPRVIYMATGQGRTVRIETFNDCRAALYANNLTLSAPGAGRVCRPADADVMVSDTVGGRRCPIRSFHILSPEETAALPRSDRP